MQSPVFNSAYTNTMDDTDDAFPTEDTYSKCHTYSLILGRRNTDSVVGVRHMGSSPEDDLGHGSILGFCNKACMHAALKKLASTT